MGNEGRCAMSLTPQEMQATRTSFQENITLLNQSFEEIAQALNTSTAYVQAVANLDAVHIEDPWILKNYLEEKLQYSGKEAVPFTALKGDFHQYWFLDSQRIEAGQLGR